MDASRSTPQFQLPVCSTDTLTSKAASSIALAPMQIANARRLFLVLLKKPHHVLMRSQKFQNAPHQSPGNPLRVSSHSVKRSISSLETVFIFFRPDQSKNVANVRGL
jgi:hypothetical protein